MTYKWEGALKEKLKCKRQKERHHLSTSGRETRNRQSNRTGA